MGEGRREQSTASLDRLLDRPAARNLLDPAGIVLCLDAGMMPAWAPVTNMTTWTCFPFSLTLLLLPALAACSAGPDPSSSASPSEAAAGESGQGGAVAGIGGNAGNGSAGARRACPSEETVHQGGGCEQDARSCSSTDNAYPADCNMYAKSSCVCQSGTWSCAGFAIDCHKTAPAVCPAPAGVGEGAACEGDNLLCEGLFNAACPWNYEPGKCSCKGGKWSCMADAVDCHAQLSKGCPADADIKSGAACGGEGQLCLSKENAFPEACGGFDAAACNCKDGVWSCYQYPVNCHLERLTEGGKRDAPLDSSASVPRTSARGTLGLESSGA
jgi:hypothetical protein